MRLCLCASHPLASFRCELTGKVFLVSLFNFQGPVPPSSRDSFVIIPPISHFVNTFYQFFSSFFAFVQYSKKDTTMGILFVYFYSDTIYYILLFIMASATTICRIPCGREKLVDGETHFLEDFTRVIRCRAALLIRQTIIVHGYEHLHLTN